MPLDLSTALSPAAGSATVSADPITEAVGRAVRGAAPVGREELKAAEAMCAAGDTAPGTLGEALDFVLALVARDPGSERLQILAARLLERARGRAGAIAAWRGVRDRFPRCHEAVLVALRWAVRTEGLAAAMAEILRNFRAPPETASDMLLLARALDELGDRDRAEAAFAALTRAQPGYELGHLLWAQAEERRGNPWRADRILRTGLAKAGRAPRLKTAAERLGAELRLLEPVAPPEEEVTRAHVGSRVLAHLLDRAAERRGRPGAVADPLGPVLMIGGSLGAGGAERQMVNTAVELQRARLRGQRVAGRRLGGSVQVFCRSLEDRPGGAFFLPELQRHQVPVTTYAALPEFGGDPARSVARECADLLRFLPPRLADGTARLADAIRAAAPSVVHLWQDGAILAGALAALLAAVPRIVLSVRTAPPPDRPERDQPEYAVLYPRLMRMPGVVLTANSRFAAARYAEWIGIDPSRVRVIPNGLAPQRITGSRETRAMMSGFRGRTGGGFTLGGIMRFDENKRPLLWLDCAAALLAARPDARFILVGDGPLRAEAEARAAALGIAGRVLFTGRSADVGYWLARMDALLLLSRCEGLPNVLIEAQSAGVPVVTTPAGGAPETLLHGETGFLLDSATNPRSDEVVARLLELAAAGGRSGRLSRAARRFVAERFSLRSMVVQTVGSYVD